MKHIDRPETGIKPGFYKVDQTGGSFIIATFFNPATTEYYTEVVRDYDYSDGSRDKDDLYYMPINETARRAYLHQNGEILPGDMVMIVKGRKVKPGTVGKVTRTRDIKDRYNRYVATYIVLEDGQQTNKDNAILVMDTNPCKAV